MTSAPHFPAVPPAAAVIERPPRRLRLRPKATTAGHVHGTWWPRSRNLVAELPALLAAPAVRLRDVLRVSYDLSEWNPAPRRVDTDSRQVRLDGFTSRPAHTADLVAADRHRLTLLVVPSNTDPATALGTTVSTRRTTDPTHITPAGRAADGGRVPEQTSRSTS
ncbi:DUF5994 family protein [Saccharothrix xinjiangensis]|uniref:DUF5994 family protein n=1 Tax=Saccharothrix xinjiangensis TaxID=204798 RepID=A0ABV9XZC5_9PSEU